jgi:A118 family predicted phage portal protein
MFQKILQWIREVINKMLGQSSVKSALNIDVAISPDMAAALQAWSLMYANQAPWLNNDVHSLNLPAAIAGEIARAVTIEMQVTIEGSPRADYLALQFNRVMDKLRQQVEYGCAKGGLMLKPFVNGQQIDVDFVQADQFYPVAFDANGNITACVFADQRIIGRDFYTRLEYHRMTPEGCEVKNMAYKSSAKDMLGNQVPLAAVDAWAGLEELAVIQNIDRPLFAYFRFPQANNIDPTSPLGVSCFARSATAANGKCLIQQADEQWSNLLWEFEGGQMALYADVTAFRKKTDGTPVLPLKRLYRALNGSNDIGDEQKFQEWAPNLRDVNILNGLDAILRRIEFTCGLSYGTLSNPQSVDKTATELKISQQRYYATITDTQKALQNALEQLLYAMDIWASLNKLAPKGAYSAVYDFDDSVIVDKDAQFKQDMQLVNGNIMSKVEFRMRNFGEDEATAKAKIAMIDAEQNAQLAYTPAQ